MAIDILVTPHRDDATLYAGWLDSGNGEMLVNHIHEVFLDLMPFLVARRLHDRGYDLDSQLIVRLQGSNRDMMRAPLGVAAAPPLVNTVAPIRHRAHVVYWRDHDERG